MTLPRGWKPVEGMRTRESGQAYVYPVRRDGDQRVYALKRLRNDKRAARFKREIVTMRALHAAGLPIPEIVECDDEAGTPFFVMPWFHDGTLEGRVEDGAFARDLDSGLTFLIGLAEALAQVHEVVAHRDLKPANVLLEGDRGFLTDFGLCLSAVDGDPRLTAEDEAVGSRFYIAPENENGLNEDLDQRPADFYAFGKIAWVVLAGRRPLAREDHTLPENRLSVLHDDIRLQPLDALLADMTSRELRKRLVDWVPVVQILGDVRLGLRDEQQGDSVSDEVERAIAAARVYEISTYAIEAGRRTQHAEGLTIAFNDLWNALQHWPRKAQVFRELSSASELLGIDATSGYELRSAPRGELSRFGIATAPALESRLPDVTKSLTTSGCPSAIRINVADDSQPDVIQLGLHPVIVDEEVWILRAVLAIWNSPHRITPMPLPGDRYARLIGPLKLGLETTDVRARAMLEELVEDGIRLFRECAEHLRAGRPLANSETWMSSP